MPAEHSPPEPAPPSTDVESARRAARTTTARTDRVGPVAAAPSVAAAGDAPRRPAAAVDDALGALLRTATAARAPATAGVARMAVGGVPEDPDDVEGQVLGGALVAGVRPGTAAGNTLARAGTPVTIKTTNHTAANWMDHGQFEWIVRWKTTGRNGWIVQKVVNTYKATDASGTDVTPAFTPSYYEAWAVDGAGEATPHPAPSGNDWWLRPSVGSGTKGTWSMTASCYWMTTDPATKGMTAGAVADAGILLSSTSAPAGLGKSKLTRKAKGSWNSQGATPKHTGSAK